jgi:hypothetical protein
MQRCAAVQWVSRCVVLGEVLRGFRRQLSFGARLGIEKRQIVMAIKVKAYCHFAFDSTAS